MPVLFQLHISRDDLRRNREVLYVFGDNTLRKGKGGQALEMRGEPNAVGVATKYTPAHVEAAYFTEDALATASQCRQIDEDMKALFAHVVAGGVVVWPIRGIGTGIAELKTRAPSTFDHIQRKLAALVRAAKLFDRGEIERAKREEEAA